MNLRRATDSDLVALARMYWEFHNFHVRGVPCRLRFAPEDDPETFAAIGKVLADPRAVVFVAEGEQQLLGFVEAYLRESSSSAAVLPRKYVHIQSLWVQTEIRSQGLGSALLGAVEEWGRGLGAIEIELETWVFPEGPLPFYERLDFETVKRTMRRVLKDRPAKVIIVDYDEEWPNHFATLRGSLKEALGDLALAIEHVGSTSVPGLAAKPIIDIDIVVGDNSLLPEVARRLATLGYVYQGNQGIVGREAFKAPAGLTSHHLYVCPADSPELHKHLVFRDYLREHPEAARAYGDLKKQLALTYIRDRIGYTEAKTEFITAVMEKCRDHYD